MVKHRPASLVPGWVTTKDIGDESLSWIKTRVSVVPTVIPHTLMSNEYNDPCGHVGKSYEKKIF